MFSFPIISILLPLLVSQHVALSSPLSEIKRATADEVAGLLKRAPPSPNDPNFASNYPAMGSPPTNIPQAWKDKLNSIKLPANCPQATGNGYPSYGNGVNGGGPDICSFTYACVADTDLYKPPNGRIGLNFDDGPAGGSDELYDFLQQNNASDKATHFMIGSSILANPNSFVKIFNGGGHIAVHTWSHLYTTTLSNEQILGELGWTMQIISDLSGGRVPQYWRPPYGDVDNRVRAIAKGVFGLETVVWNQDTGDWAIGSNPQYTMDSVCASYANLLQNKNQGLNVLEHELSSTTVQVFKRSYPLMVSNGWNIANIADTFGVTWYQNSARTNFASVTSLAVGGTASSISPNSTTSSSSSSSAAASSSSASSASASASASKSSSASASAISTQAALSPPNTSQGAGSKSSSPNGLVVQLISTFFLGLIGVSVL